MLFVDIVGFFMGIFFIFIIVSIVKNVMRFKKVKKSATNARQNFIQNIMDENSDTLDEQDFLLMENMNTLALKEYVMNNDLRFNEEILQDAMNNEILNNETLHLTNPYETVGIDAVIDHDYHGIQNGLAESDFGHESVSDFDHNQNFDSFGQGSDF